MTPEEKESIKKLVLVGVKALRDVVQERVNKLQNEIDGLKTEVARLSVGKDADDLRSMLQSKLRIKGKP